MEETPPNTEIFICQKWVEEEIGKIDKHGKEERKKSLLMGKLIKMCSLIPQW